MFTKNFTYVLLIGSYISLILTGCNSTNRVPYQSEYMNINLTYSQELVKKNGDDNQLILTLNDVGMIDVYAYPRAAETFEYSLGNSLGESIDDNEVITILSALNEFQWMGEYPPSAIVEQPKRIMVNNFSGAIMTTLTMLHSMAESHSKPRFSGTGAIIKMFNN